MTDFIVTQPCAAFGYNLEAVKLYISEHNAAILLGTEFPVNTGTLDVQEMIGNPNNTFSDEVCELLNTHGVLTKLPWLNEHGKQMHYEHNNSKMPVWVYDWGTTSFLELDEATLLGVGWDLRYTGGFYNLVTFNPPEAEVTTTEAEADIESANDDSNANNSDDANYFNSSVLTTE